MIDDRMAYRLFEYIAFQAFREVLDGKTLAEIDDRLTELPHEKGPRRPVRIHGRTVVCLNGGGARKGTPSLGRTCAP